MAAAGGSWKGGKFIPGGPGIEANKPAKTMYESLSEIGNAWEKGGKRRVYFNDLAAMMDLEIDRRPGRMEGATINGETISRDEARGILRQIAYGRVWYDAADNNFHYQNLDRDVFDYVRAGVIRKVNARSA